MKCINCFLFSFFFSSSYIGFNQFHQVLISRACLSLMCCGLIYFIVFELDGPKNLTQITPKIQNFCNRVRHAPHHALRRFVLEAYASARKVGLAAGSHLGVTLKAFLSCLALSGPLRREPYLSFVMLIFIYCFVTYEQSS